MLIMLFDWQGIAFVKISNPEEAKEYGIDHVPSLIYFENGIPSIYEGMPLPYFFSTFFRVTLLLMLPISVKSDSHDSLSARLCGRDWPWWRDAGINHPLRVSLFLCLFVAMTDGLVFIPGDLKDEEQVLEWLIHQVESDEIEDVTDEMLDMLIKRSKHLAVLFCN